MERYTFQDLILSEESDVVYVKLSDAEGLINELYETINRNASKIIKLKEQNKEMLEALKEEWGKIESFLSLESDDILPASYNMFYGRQLKIKALIQKVEEREE